jgi:hypothetical protein
MRVLRTSMLALALTGLALALAGGPLGPPVGAPGQALAADDEPAACTDQRLNRRIKEQYEFADSIRDAKRTVREQADIKEIGLGSAPISSLAPRPKDLKITSRYCQAAIVLDNGEKDTLYWRIDVIVQGSERSTNYDHCSIRHDTFEDQCISYRERN